MKLTKQIFNKLPIQLVKILYNDNLLLPFYHTVSNEHLPHLSNLYKYRNINEFRNDLKYFMRDHFPIELGQLVNIVKYKKKIKKKVFFLSFDDGMSELYTIVAPILKDMGIPATFYLCPDFIDNKKLFYRHKASILVEQFNNPTELQINKLKSLFISFKLVYKEFSRSMLAITQENEKLIDEVANVFEYSFSDFLKIKKPYLTSNQIESLIKDGFSIGAHSMSHPLYSTISLDDQLQQTKQSLELLAEKYNTNYNTFAFPFNDNSVSKSFFTELYAINNFNLSFGTAGFLTDSVQYNLQRFSMEGIDGTTEVILKYHAYNKIKSIIKRKNLISRAK